MGGANSDEWEVTGRVDRLCGTLGTHVLCGPLGPCFKFIPSTFPFFFLLLNNCVSVVTSPFFSIFYFCIFVNLGFFVPNFSRMFSPSPRKKIAKTTAHQRLIFKVHKPVDVLI
jgi:hypothetical protein